MNKTNEYEGLISRYLSYKRAEGLRESTLGDLSGRLKMIGRECGITCAGGERCADEFVMIGKVVPIDLKFAGGEHNVDVSGVVECAIPFAAGVGVATAYTRSSSCASCSRTSYLPTSKCRY